MTDDLSAMEHLKARSRYLRGDLAEDMADPHTAGVTEDSAQLLKFHGMYLQDDRDLRPERMKKMLEKKNWQRLVPDQNLIASDNPEDNGYIVSAVSQDGDFLMAYTPFGKKFTIKTDKIKSDNIKASWFNPRDGNSIPIGTFRNDKEIEFAPQSEGRGSDWLLVVEKN